MVEAPAPSPKAKKRSVGLTIWLWLLVIGAIFAAIANFGGAFTFAAFGVPTWASILLGLLAVANLVFLYYIFQWKMLGFQGIVATTVIAFIVNLIIGVGFGSALLGLIGPVVLYLFMRPQWSMFK